MRWRPLIESDVQACLDSFPGAAGAELLGPLKTFQAWIKLVHSPGFNGIVLEKETPGRPPKFAGFGASVFVSDAFALSELQAPRPGLNARVLQELSIGTRAILPLDAIAKDNAGHGLNTVVLCGRWTDETLTDGERAQAEVFLSTVFVERHAGYHFKRMLVEVADARDDFAVTASFIWRKIPFLAGNSGHQPSLPIRNPYQCLAVIEMPEMRSVYASVIGPLFYGSPPKLGFTRTGQELLEAALNGSTDSELAAQLGLTLSAVKRRWSGLYNHVESVWPDFFQDSTGKRKSGIRGPQKRHILLDYVRNHKEEIRPYKK